MAELRKYLDNTGLSTLIDQIKAEDAKALQSAKDYADGLAKNYDAAGAANTVKEELQQTINGLSEVYDAKGSAAAVDTKLTAEVERATAKENELAGSIAGVKTTADQAAADILAINNAETGILATAKAYTDTEVGKVQSAVDELTDFVGVLPEGATVDNVVAYVDAKTANIASDETVAAIDTRLTAAEGAIDAIEADYLKASDKDELTDAIEAAQAAADAAQGHSEGVAGNLATETSERKAADEAQVERIAALEGQITGLSGAMHFEGVKDEVPTDLTGYENGDVIIVGNKEYVFNGTAFVEFGDASVNAEAITALTGRVETAEGEIDTLQGEMDAVEEAVAKKVEQSVYDAKVAELAGADSAMAGRLDTIEAQLGTGEGSVSDQIADAKAEAISEATATAAADAKAKADQALADAKTYADAEDGKIKARVDALEGASHTHANATVLDGISADKVTAWDDAASKAHVHANATVLDGISAEKVAAWDAAEKNAKDYADGLNSAMTSKVDAIGTRVGTLETTIVDKADQDDLDAAVERIAANEAAIAANTSAINSFTAITPAEIEALFA